MIACEQHAFGQFFDAFRNHARRVVTQLQLSLDAAEAQDPDLAERVIAGDDTFDIAEKRFEEQIYTLLTEHRASPSDLRLILGCLKINTFFERLADHAVNLARLTQKLHLLTDRDLPEELTQMCERVGNVADRSLAAFLNGDAALASSVAAEDVLIDRLDKAVQRKTEDMALSSASQEIPGGAQTVIPMAFVLFRFARELERIGDILANWAESVVLVTTGNDIRHRPKPNIARRA